MKKRVTQLLSNWLFEVLGGTFVEGATLYVPAGQVEAARLGLEGVVEDSTLNIGYSITDGRVFPIATKSEVKAPYMVYDSIEVYYERTKDGSYPANVTARIVCVERSYTAAEALADAVEEKLADRCVESMGAECVVTSRGSDYDPNTGEFLEYIRIKVEL